MNPSSIPDGIPVLSRGRHRTPRRGACFMEYASVLAGERWSDHPSCTHPLLAYLARLVNDHTSDDGRQKLAPLIPPVVCRRGNDRTWLTVAVAAQTILDVPESTRRVLATGLLQAERLCADGEPDLAATRREAQLALGMVSPAVAWVDRLGVRSRIDANTFAKRCATQRPPTGSSPRRLPALRRGRAPLPCPGGPAGPAGCRQVLSGRGPRRQAAAPRHGRAPQGQPQRGLRGGRRPRHRRTGGHLLCQVRLPAVL